jgi:pullulanase-type alpha-1,6-glucosidase
LHYTRPDGNYTGWGLHLWGDAIDPSEATEWTSPKAFNGQDSYGVFAFVKLQDASKPLNFIVHKGDEKDPDGDRSFVPSETPEVWLKSADATIYASQVSAQGYVRIHYTRPDATYTGWGLHLWGDAIDPSEATEWTSPKPFAGSDSYGVYADVKLQDASKAVNFIVHKGDEKDPDGDRSFVPSEVGGEVWLKSADATIYGSRAAAEQVAVIHYHRPAGDYGTPGSDFTTFWGMHVWTGAATPNPSWQEPVQPSGQDAFGIYFRVPLAAGATTLSYIIHKGDEKDQPEDQSLDLLTVGHEVWILQNTPGYLLPLERQDCGPPANQGDLSKQKAHWVAEDTLAWDIQGGAANTYKLHYDPTGAIALGPDKTIAGGQSIDLTFDPAGLSQAIKDKFPHLAGFAALKIGAADLAKAPEILKGQIAVSATGPAGNQVDATGVQIPGVLDDLYANDSPLGVTYQGAKPTLRVWAPTAKSVKLHLFANSNPATTSAVYPMTADPATGVWSIAGAASWTYKFYLYEVEVFVPSTGQVEHNLVTDPYSISLATNSKRSQIVNLASPWLKPGGWDWLKKPGLVAPEDIALYELHVRDFSINDTTVTRGNRGTFMAFTEEHSNGMRHLAALADAGLTHVHLLPAFDCASIEEDKALRQEPDPAALATFPPASDQQQALIEPLRDKDGFNWCYDPFHYSVPEGSYATNPDGAWRIVQFREMVKALNHKGLRVVMDVVYNHTATSGQAEKSVLDKVVPGYYQRLNLDGAVETSTCCANTASEHAMMEKLMVDSLVTWATAYKVDGFRFDLMGHHMKANMLKVRDRLRALTLARDGVDGSKIYLYGEGWNFGEVADNARGENATQLNLAGTGIGTFSDRLRDAVRGGGPFDNGANKKIQGFANGLYYDPNDLPQGGPDAQKQRLLLYQDQIKVGLAGNLKDYMLVDRTGASVRGDQVDYNGSPAGYTLDPQEVITYIEAHDNETLFDKNQYAAPTSASIADRVRMQNLGISIVTLSQGVPFLQAGQDMLRSKSLDRNSYNSGDWFNKLDFTYRSNNWGVGLPPAGDNGSNWPIIQPLLANPALKPARSDILDAVDHFREMLRIRNSSPLFRLRSGAEIKARLSFLNTGPNQVAGLIVMQLSDTTGANIDKHYKRIVVLFNANDQAQTFAAPGLQGLRLRLHPVQAFSADWRVRTSTFNRITGTFVVPARTTAVFVLDD